MTRVNMGDRPAPAICTEALYKTAKLFETDNPKAAELIVKSTYVDDIVDSFVDTDLAVETAAQVEEMLKKGGFRIKCWQLSGKPLPGADDTGAATTEQIAVLKGSGDVTPVCGVGWIPVEDVLVFQICLNFLPKRKGVEMWYF